MTKIYTGNFRQEGDVWIAEVAEVPQAHTFGKTLSRARDYLHDALALYLDVPSDSIEIDVNVVTSDAAVSKAVNQARQARRVEEEARKNVQVAVPTAAKRLVGLGYSLRDIAVMLDLSHQRVQQLVSEASQTGAAAALKAARSSGVSTQAAKTARGKATEALRDAGSERTTRKGGKKAAPRKKVKESA